MKNKRSRPFRRANINRSSSDSFNNGYNGSRIRGSLTTVLEKYKNLAKDATSSGDYISAENYLQHAEHYNRVLNGKAERNSNLADSIKKTEMSQSQNDQGDEAENLISETSSDDATVAEA